MVGDKDTGEPWPKNKNISISTWHKYVERNKDGDEQDKEYDEHKDTRGYNTASNS